MQPAPRHQPHHPTIDPQLAEVTLPLVALLTSLTLNGAIYSLAELYACQYRRRGGGKRRRRKKEVSKLVRFGVVLCVLSNTLTTLLRMHRAQSLVMGHGLADTSARNSLRWDYIGFMLAFAPVRTMTQFYFGRRAWILDRGGASPSVGSAARVGRKGKVRRSAVIKWVGLGVIGAEAVVGVALPVAFFLARHEEGDLGSGSGDGGGDGRGMLPMYSPAFAADLIQALYVSYNLLNVLLQASISYLFANALRRMDAALQASRNAVSLLTRMQLASAMLFCALSGFSIFTLLCWRLPNGSITDAYVLPLGLMEDMFPISFFLALLVRESVRSAMKARGEVDVLSPEAGQFFFRTSFIEGEGQGGDAGKSVARRGSSKTAATGVSATVTGWIPFWSLVVPAPAPPPQASGAAHVQSGAALPPHPAPESNQQAEARDRNDVDAADNDNDATLPPPPARRRGSSLASFLTWHVGPRRRSSATSTMGTTAVAAAANGVVDASLEQ